MLRSLFFKEFYFYARFKMGKTVALRFNHFPKDAQLVNGEIMFPTPSSSNHHSDGRSSAVWQNPFNFNEDVNKKVASMWTWKQFCIL